MLPVADIPSRASLRSAETADIDIPRTRLRFGDRAFSVAGAKHWNSLPAELRLIADTSTFKKQLKPYLSRVHINIPYMISVMLRNNVVRLAGMVAGQSSRI